MHQSLHPLVYADDFPFRNVSNYCQKANIKRIKYFFSQIQQLLFGLMLTTTKEQE